MDLSNITRLAGRVGLHLQKHAPTIMVASGTVGMVATAVMASKATLRLSDTVAPHIRDLEAVAKATEINEQYAKNDALSDRVKLYTRITVDVTKLYLPTLVVGGTSIALIASGHGLMLKRYAALGAAYTSLKESYDRLAQEHDTLISSDEETTGEVKLLSLIHI